MFRLFYDYYINEDCNICHMTMTEHTINHHEFLMRLDYTIDIRCLRDPGLEMDHVLSLATNNRGALTAE